MDDLESFPALVADSYWGHEATTMGEPVARLDVDVLGIEAEGTVVPVAAIGQWEHLIPALFTLASEYADEIAHRDLNTHLASAVPDQGSFNLVGGV